MDQNVSFIHVHTCGCIIYRYTCIYTVMRWYVCHKCNASYHFWNVWLFLRYVITLYLLFSCVWMLYVVCPSVLDLSYVLRYVSSNYVSCHLRQSCVITLHVWLYQMSYCFLHCMLPSEVIHIKYVETCLSSGSFEESCYVQCLNRFSSPS